MKIFFRAEKMTAPGNIIEQIAFLFGKWRCEEKIPGIWKNSGFQAARWYSHDEFPPQSKDSTDKKKMQNVMGGWISQQYD